MVVIATASPIMLTVTRLFLGLSTPVLQERCIITTAKQRNPSGRNQKNGLNERGERRKGKTRKNEIWVKPKMDVTLEETLHSIESIWLPQNQANTCRLQRVFTENIVLLTNEMVTTLSLGIPPVIRERTCRDSVRWSRHVQYTLQLFPLLFTGLLLLLQMLEERQLFHLQGAYRMSHHQPRHLRASICMTTHHTLPHQI